MSPTLRAVTLVLVVSGLTSSCLYGQTNLVANGSFQLDEDHNSVPDNWATAGAASVVQTLTLDSGPDGSRAGKLTCTEFSGNSSSCHAMLCQVGKVGLTARQWYRVRWQAKAQDLSRNVISLSLSNTRTWSGTGLNYSFPVGAGWRQYEHVFLAEQDLPAAASRLQFWFQSTGTLWLANVQLEPVAGLQYEYHPQISTSQVTNYIPNSSFECGRAGWGSYYPDMNTWAGNVFDLIGQIDSQVAYHGQHSLRIDVDKSQAPVFMWDWFDLVDEQILTPLAAHHGWVRLERGSKYVVSCMLRADRPDVPARLLVREGERNRSHHVQVGPEWQRRSMAFSASDDFAWIGVGPDLSESDLASATLWVDAVQLEKGEAPSEYQARTALESMLSTDMTGNTFLDPAEGLSVQITVFNAGRQNVDLQGELRVTDFWDQTVHRQQLQLVAAAQKQTCHHVDQLLAGRTGFFRVSWTPSGVAAKAQNLRCMVIQPYRDTDSVFGMNHAYGWPVLLQLAKQAGLTWWRDWSVKWHQVEAVKGQFDFSATDPQIDRVLDQGLNVDVMFPFPSSEWSTTADMDAIRKVESNRYRHQVLRLACAPASTTDFQRYITRSVQHYKDRIQYFQVFNEPVYTHYSLPQRLGYTVADYVHWLEIAAQAIRGEHNQAVVVGGMGSWAGTSWTRDFVRAGGLKSVDILDLHCYPVTADPESYEQDIVELTDLMRERGEVRPMWLTEFGCYADDDPYRTPQQVGDAAMSRSLWPSEQEASAALVQTMAVLGSHGLRKIFLHAGTCGPINGSSAGGVFFEYGGTPRKMLPAVAALSQLMDTDFQPVDAGPQPPDRRIYLFQVRRGLLAIAWSRTPQPPAIPCPDQVTVLDIMGCQLSDATVKLTATPTYFLTTRLSPAELKKKLAGP